MGNVPCTRDVACREMFESVTSLSWQVARLGIAS